MLVTGNDTIAAIATADGAGGIGIVRLSGPQAATIAAGICERPLSPRRVRYTRFLDADGTVIDDGVALYFKAPGSFTGEDVVELQAHASPALLRSLLARCCELGARMARAGEFSERAFHHGKLDLAQAEALADLIGSGDLRAARAARRALDGVFSQQVNALAQPLLAMRVQVEAAIDFADEALDTAGTSALIEQLRAIKDAVQELLRAARAGQRLRDGVHAVIVGPPNAGKSSLLNALAGHDAAIVTDVPGTTRDLLREAIRLDGVELTLVDSAGLREAGDAIEREGVRRARAELQRADLAVVVLDARDIAAGRAAVEPSIADVPQQLWLLNKIDLLDGLPSPPVAGALSISVRTGQGMDVARQCLRRLALGDLPSAEGGFTARARQVDALRRAQAELEVAAGALADDRLDLAAEALRLGHDALGEITGRIVPDALLGHIFSTFCVGK